MQAALENETPAQRADKAAQELKLTLTAVFVPWSQSRNKAEKQPSLNWKVTLLRDGREVLTTDYMAGSGHCPAHKREAMKDKGLYRALIRWECEHGYGVSPNSTYEFIRRGKGAPLMPLPRDVMHSLVMDADVLDHSSFESWAIDFGYETDSRKAEATYRACIEIALKMRAAIGDEGLRALQTAFQDY